MAARVANRDKQAARFLGSGLSVTISPGKNFAHDKCQSLSDGGNLDDPAIPRNCEYV